MLGGAQLESGRGRFGRSIAWTELQVTYLGELHSVSLWPLALYGSDVYCCCRPLLPRRRRDAAATPPRVFARRAQRTAVHQLVQIVLYAIRSHAYEVSANV
jgi:hypothetical protein